MFLNLLFIVSTSIAVITSLIGTTAKSDTVFFLAVPISLLFGVFAWRSSRIAFGIKIAAVWTIIITFSGWALWPQETAQPIEWIPPHWYILPLILIGFLFTLISYLVHLRST